MAVRAHCRSSLTRRQSKPSCRGAATNVRTNRTRAGASRNPVADSETRIGKQVSFGFDVTTLRFDAPVFLWLLVIPSVLFVICLWQMGRRRRDVRNFSQRRTLLIR